MKLTLNYEGGRKEKIGLGEYAREFIYSVLKISAAIIALAALLLLAWILLPPWWVLPFVGSVLYAACEYLSVLLPEDNFSEGIRDAPDPRWPPG